MLLTGFAPQTWSWANSNPQNTSVTIEATEPGLHTLHLWQREDGLRLDRIRRDRLRLMLGLKGGLELIQD